MSESYEGTLAVDVAWTTGLSDVHEPPRRFRHDGQNQDDHEEGQDDAESEHDPPLLVDRQSRERQSGGEPHDDPYVQRDFRPRHKLPAVPRRRHFGDVQRIDLWGDR